MRECAVAMEKFQIAIATDHRFRYRRGVTIPWRFAGSGACIRGCQALPEHPCRQLIFPADPYLSDRA